MRSVLYPLFALCLVPGWILAADVTWDGEGVELLAPFGPDDDWDNDDNWDTDSEPGNTDDVIVDSAGAPGQVHLVLQPVTVKSMTCKAPFLVDNTLILSAPSEFTDSLLPNSNGKIESSSMVTLKGNNHAGLIGFDGTGTFENQGNLTLEDDTASARLVNNNIVNVLANGNVSLHKFLNNNTLILGPDVVVDSSSAITNAANVAFGSGGVGDIRINGAFTQVSGQVLVPPFGNAAIRGGTQSYRGGNITVQTNGTLSLSYVTGAITEIAYNGLQEVNGNGQLLQNTAFDVLQNVTLNMQAPGFYDSSDLEVAAGATLNNAGVMKIGGEISGPGTFQNTGTMETISNPNLNVLLLNNSTWNCQSCRVGTNTLNNNGTLNLSGDGKKFSISQPNPGTLRNSLGSIILDIDPGALNQVYVVEVPFEQLNLGRTEVRKGILRFLSVYPTIIGGSWDVGNFQELDLHSPNMQTVPSGAGDTVTFTGEGSVNFGKTPTTAGYMVHAGDGVVTRVESFRHARGNWRFDAGASLTIEKGEYFWRNGHFYSNEPTGLGDREVRNKSLLQIQTGGNRQLGVRLINEKQPFEATGTWRVDQGVSISLLDGSTTNGSGRIHNKGRWDISGNANITGRLETNGPATDASFYNDGGRLTVSNLCTIGVDLYNRGSIYVYGTLNLDYVHNLTPDGTLSNGFWNVDPGATLNMPVPVTSLRHGCTWSGGGNGSITNIGSDNASEWPAALFVDNNSEGTQPLTIRKSGKMVVNKLGSWKGPELILAGDLEGDGLIESLVSGENYFPGLSKLGRIRPGRSPGTLTIAGDFSMGSLEYEWETMGTTNGASDLLVVSNSVTLSGGIVPVLLNDFVPTPGTVFTVLVANAISGQFDYVSLGELPYGVTFTPEYSTTAVTLTAGSTNYTSFADWQAANFRPSDQTNAMVSGATADPEGDRFKNLAEYAHGLGPAAMNNGVLEIDQILPGTVDLRFPWVDGLTDVTYSVVASTEIDGDYDPVPHSVVGAVSDGTVSETTIRVTTPAVPVLFLQLMVEELP